MKLFLFYFVQSIKRSALHEFVSPSGVKAQSPAMTCGFLLQALCFDLSSSRFVLGQSLIHRCLYPLHQNTYRLNSGRIEIWELDGAEQRECEYSKLHSPILSNTRTEA